MRSACSLRAPGVVKVVVGVDRGPRLVGAGQRVEDALRVRGKHPRVGLGVDHQRGAADAGQVRFGPGLRHPQAPHAQPVPQRARRGDAVRGTVRLGRDTRVARVGLALGGLDGRIHHAGVGPGAHHRKRAVRKPRGANAFQLFFGPVGDGVVARGLCGPVAGKELRRIRRAVALVEQVEVGVGGDGVVLVDDGGVHPGGEHLRAPRVRGGGHIAVGRRQVGQPRRRAHPVQRGHVRLDGLRLVGGHQRSAARIAQQHNGIHSLDIAQPAHTDADVDQCVVEQEAALEAAEPGVPAEKTDAAGGHVVRQIVLGEVDLVVRGDHRHLRFASHAPVVEPLAGMPAGARAAGGARGQPDEFPDHPGAGTATRFATQLCGSSSRP